MPLCHLGLAFLLPLRLLDFVLRKVSMRAQGWLIDALCLAILNSAYSEGENCPFV